MMFKKVFKTSLDRFIPLLISGNKEVAVLFALLYPVSLFMNLQMEGFRIPTPDMEMQRILIMFVNALFEYFSQILKAMIVIHAVYRLVDTTNYQNKNIFSLIRKDFMQVFIERLRCVLAIAWRSLLLIFPGVREYVRLLFVDHMVILSRNYDKGDVDALEASRTLSTGHLKSLGLAWFLLIVFFIINSAICTNIIPSGIFQHLMLFTGSFLLDVFALVFMASYFLEVVEKSDLKTKGEI